MHWWIKIFKDDDGHEADLAWTRSIMLALLYYDPIWTKVTGSTRKMLAAEIFNSTSAHLRS